LTEPTSDTGWSLALVDPKNITRQLGPLSGVVTVGRSDADIVLDDPAISRTHLRLETSGADIIALDLASSYGTFVNGNRIDAPTRLASGDRITLGDSTLLVTQNRPTSQPPSRQEPPASVADSSTHSSPQPAAPDTPNEQPVVPPLGHDYKSIINDAVEIRFRPGTHGERTAGAYAAAAKKARRDLAGIGSEPWGVRPVVNLVDPFRDPDAPDDVITSGSVIDGEGGQAWVVVSPEAPPDDPHRLLALIFGSVLPCADDLDVLLEGYGLHLANATNTNVDLGTTSLPSLDDAEGDLRGAMAVSYVRFLLDRESDTELRRVLGAPAGKLEETIRDTYGSAAAKLETMWRHEVLAGETEVETGQFLRLSLRYLRPYKLRQAEIFVYMLMSLAFTATFPFVSRRLFDTAIPSGEFGQVLTLIFALAIAFVISLLASLRQAYQSAWVSGAVTRDIRESMYHKMQRLPTSWYERYPQGDVLSRLFNDVAIVEAGLSVAISQGIFQSVSLVVSAVIMLTINVPLGLVVLAGAPVVAFIYRSMSTGAVTRSIAVQEDNSELMTVAAEGYRANPVVKMFGLAGREHQRFQRQSGRLFRSERRLSLFGGLFGLSVNMIVTLLRLGVLGFGGWLIVEGRFTLGGLVAFLAIMGDVLSPVTVLTTLGQTVQESMGALVRINEVLDADEEGEESELRDLGPLTKDLRLVGLSFSYGPERKALDSIDVTITAGSKVAFVGPSGSGKSTVLRMLMRQYDPDEGAFLLDGVDVRQRSLKSLRDQTGVVFQDSFLFDTTIRENISLGKPGATDAEIIRAAEAAEIDEFIDQLPRGYDTVVGDAGGNLSGGQRQRVAIARALVRDPRLLLLDEATSALDPRTESQINKTLDRIAANRTTVSITHRLTSVVEHDRIYVIDAGAVVEQGTHAELLTIGGLYARLWAEQTGSEPPDAPSFDLAAAVSAIPLFGSLGDEAVAAFVGRLGAFDLAAGDTLEDGGGIVVIERGKGNVMVATGHGDRAVSAELGPGDAYGVTAVLGGSSTGLLLATTPMRLHQIDHSLLRGAAAEFPGVAEALAGRTEGVSPGHRRRLSRLTLGSPRSHVSPTVTVPTPATADIRRTMRALPSVNR